MMDLEQIEFTMEEVLIIHREWIAKLYVQDRKTEAEITKLLSHQKLIVTVDQVQKCIQDWNLQPLPSYPAIPNLDLEKLLNTCSYALCNTTPTPSQQTGNNSTLKPNTPLPNPHTNPSCSSTPRTFTTSNNYLPPLDLHLTPIYPTDQDHRYTTRPFPHHHHPAHRIHPPHPPRYCTHGYPPSCCPQVRSCLASLPTTGPSSLDLYTRTLQFHEKIAFSLVREGERERCYGRDVKASADHGRGSNGGKEGYAGHVRYLDDLEVDEEEEGAAYTFGARGDEMGGCKRQKKEEVVEVEVEAELEESSVTGLTPEFDDVDDDNVHGEERDLDVVVYDDLYGLEDEDSERAQEGLYEVKFVGAGDKLAGGSEPIQRVKFGESVRLEKKRKRADGERK